MRRRIFIALLGNLFGAANANYIGARIRSTRQVSGSTKSLLLDRLHLA